MSFEQIERRSVSRPSGPEKAGPGGSSRNVTAAGKQVYADAGLLALDIGL